MRAEQLRKILAIGLSPEHLKAVLEICTERSKGADRQAKYQARKRQNNVRMTRQNNVSSPLILPQDIQRSSSRAFLEKDPVVVAREKPISRFPEFRAVYPRRQGAQPWAKAEKKFNSLVAKGVDPEEIIGAAGLYAQQQEKLEKVGTEYIAMATTWLNQERWKDVEDHQIEDQEARFAAALRAVRSGNGYHA